MFMKILGNLFIYMSLLFFLSISSKAEQYFINSMFTDE